MKKNFNFYKNLMFNAIRTTPFLLLIVCAILFSNIDVYAQEWAVESSEITSPSSSGSGKYSGHEYYLYGSNSVYNIGTRYNGRLSEVWFNLIAGGYADANGFEQGHTYTLTINMATEDWRNNFGTASVKCEGSSGTELSNGRVSFISKKKIKVSFTAPTSGWCQFVYVHLKSTSINTVGITGVNNWNLSSMSISDPYYNDSSGGGSGGSGTSTPSPSNQDIIDNASQNTQSIINNDTQNTQDIIENNNANTEQIIENQNENSNQATYVCKTITNKDNYKWKTGYYYENNGTLLPTNNYYYATDFIKVAGSTTLTFSQLISPPNYHLLFYDKDFNLLSANAINNTTYSLPSNIYYIKFSLSKVNYEAFNLKTDKCIYIDKQLEISNSIDQVNDTIKDSNIDSGTGSDFFNDFDDEDFGLSDIITIPLTTIQGLTSKTCTPLTVPIPFTNSNITLPCMTEIYQDKFPSIYNLWKIVSFGIIAYFIATDIFYLVKGFKDPESDKVEVLDL